MSTGSGSLVTYVMGCGGLCLFIGSGCNGSPISPCSAAYSISECHWHFFVYTGATPMSSGAQLSLDVCQPYETQLRPVRGATYASTKKVISHQLKGTTTESTNLYHRGSFNPAYSPHIVIQWGQSQPQHGNNMAPLPSFPQVWKILK